MGIDVQKWQAKLESAETECGWSNNSQSYLPHGFVFTDSRPKSSQM
jgi:hypothetical protein